MTEEQQKPAQAEKMHRFMPPPTPEAVIAMYEAMTGRAMTQEQKIAMRAKLAALRHGGQGTGRRSRERTSTYNAPRESNGTPLLTELLKSQIGGWKNDGGMAEARCR